MPLPSAEFTTRGNSVAIRQGGDSKENGVRLVIPNDGVDTFIHEGSPQIGAAKIRIGSSGDSAIYTLGGSPKIIGRIHCANRFSTMNTSVFENDNHH